jgi:hypothetical protein
MSVILLVDGLPGNYDGTAGRGQVTTTRCEGEVLEVRPANSKPDRGIARLRYQAKTSATIRFCPSSSFICCADGR